MTARHNRRPRRVVSDAAGSPADRRGCPFHDLAASCAGGPAPDAPARRAGLAAVRQGRPAHHGRDAVRGSDRPRVPVSLATVYNTLHQFTEAGLLREVAVDGVEDLFRHQHRPSTTTSSSKARTAASTFRPRRRGRRVLPEPPDGMEIAGVDVIVRLRQKAARCRPYRRRRLVHLLVRIDAPERLSCCDVAVEVRARSTMSAPGCPSQCFTRADDAGCRLRDDSARSSARSSRDAEAASPLPPGRDQAGAPARQQAVQHPAFRALGIADAPPGLELGDDLDGQAGALEHPAVRWSFDGPSRRLTRSDLRLTKRGTGRPVTVPVPCRRVPARPGSGDGAEAQNERAATATRVRARRLAGSRRMARRTVGSRSIRPG